MVHVLEKMPISGNGKIDRAELISRASSLSINGGAWSENCAEPIGDLVALIIGRPPDKLDCSLVELGASSLDAVRLAHLVEDRLKLRCTPGDLLGTPSLVKFLKRLVGQGRAAVGLPIGTPFDRPRRGTAQQAAFYVEQVKAPTSTAYNIPLVITFSERPDLQALQRSLEVLVARHALLRASFQMDAGAVSMQIAPCVTVPPIETICASNETAGESLAEHVRPFDLGTAPCWRVKYVDGDVPRLLFDIHHILCDGHSLAILLEEWDLILRGRPLPQLRHTFHDWLAWRQGDISRSETADAVASAAARLSPLPAPLMLPLDRMRCGPRGWSARYCVVDLGTARMSALTQAASAFRVTPFHLLLGTYAAWISRLTGSATFVIAVPFLGRTVADSAKIVGPLVSTTYVKLDIDRSLPLGAYFRAVAASSWEAIRDQAAPSQSLAELLMPIANPQRNPLFDTFFAYQDGALDGMHALGGHVRWVPAATGATIADLNLQIEPSSDGLRATWSAAADIFDLSTLHALNDDWIELLDEILDMRRTAPTMPLSSILDSDRNGPMANTTIDFVM